MVSEGRRPRSAAERGAGRGRSPWAPEALADSQTAELLEGVSWRDQLPESLADFRTAELLEGVLDVDLDAVDVELPQGFGRD